MSAKMPPERFFTGPLLRMAELVLQVDLESLEVYAKSVDLDEVGKENMNLLYYAQYMLKASSYEKLLQLGADPNLDWAGQGNMVCMVSNKTDLFYLRVTLAQGGDPNSKFPDGIPAVMMATIHTDWEHIALLLDAGADVDITDKDGNTLLMVSVVISHYDYALNLLSRGANPRHVNNYGKTIVDRIHARPLPEGHEQLPNREKLVRELRARGIQV